MTNDLIFDVGMNNGDDTAYYLFKGFRVVAIEADPTLIDCARERFAEPIRQGRLELANVAIGPREETAPFWICEGKSEWNSFDRRISSRDGHTCHAIDVHCRPFRDLLKQFGVPYYLKIDIEGHDIFCVADLDPRSLKELVKRQLRPYPALYRFGSSLAQARRQLLPAASAHSHGPRTNGRSWTFNFGSSGAFGEDTNGPWRTLDETAYTWITFQLGRTMYGPPQIGIWFDVHARSVEAS